MSELIRRAARLPDHVIPVVIGCTYAAGRYKFFYNGEFLISLTSVLTLTVQDSDGVDAIIELGYDPCKYLSANYWNKCE